MSRVDSCEWPGVNVYSGPAVGSFLMGDETGLWEGEQEAVPVSVARQLENRGDVYLAEVKRLEARLAVADELADAVLSLMFAGGEEMRFESSEVASQYLRASTRVHAALARYREPRDIPGFEGTKEGLEVMAATAALVTKNRETNRSVSTDENTEEEA